MATTYSFGSGGTPVAGGTATQITLSDIDVTTIGSAAYNPFSSATFADGTNPNTPASQPGYLVKVQIRLFTPQSGETVTVTNTGGISFASSSTSTTADGTFTTQVINATGANFFYGTEANIQAMLRAITVSASPTGGSTAHNNVFIQFSYVSAFGVSANTTGGTSSATNTVGAAAVDFAACYVSGTRVPVTAANAETGECAIEDIRIGDMIVTAAGDIKPVKWIGRRSYTADELVGRPSLRPVLFRQGSISAGIPSRDLMVSPMHGMMLDDVIVPAASLVNGSTIVRAEVTAGVEYLHLELEGHDLIKAEGAVAETFIDNHSRMAFDNAAEYTALFGGDSVIDEVSPRVEEGFLLEAIRRRLAGATATTPTPGSLRGAVERIADGVLEGWASCGAGAVELEVLVDGEPVSRLLANRYRTDLDDAGIANGSAGFTVALPASVDSLEQVTVRSTLDGSILPVLAMATANA